MGDPAACSGNPTLAVSNRAVSTAAETSSADNVGKVKDPQVLATPGTSLALELSGCKQIEFEVRDDSPARDFQWDALISPITACQLLVVYCFGINCIVGAHTEDTIVSDLVCTLDAEHHK